METPPPENFTPKPLKLDISRYQHYLDATRLSPCEKQELLHTLWNMTCEFVYLGYGVNSVQQLTALGNTQEHLIMRDKTIETSLESSKEDC
jgi:hypothetical protein